MILLQCCLMTIRGLVALTRCQLPWQRRGISNILLRHKPELTGEASFLLGRNVSSSQHARWWDTRRYKQRVKYILSGKSLSSSSSGGGGSGSKTNNNIGDSGRRSKRPIVHLSSALCEKYQGKDIGSPYPIMPFPTSPPITLENIPMIKSHHEEPLNASPSDIIDSTSIMTLEHDAHSIAGIRQATQLAQDMIQTASIKATQPSPSPSPCSSPTKTTPPITTDEINTHIHHLLLTHKARPTFFHQNHVKNNSSSTLSSHSDDLFPKCLCANINEVVSMGIPDSRPLQSGDLLTLELEVLVMRNGDDGVTRKRTSALGRASSTFVIQPTGATNNTNISVTSSPFQGTNNWSDEDKCSNEYEEERLNRMLHLQQAASDGLEAAITKCRSGMPIQELQNIIASVAVKNGVRSLQQPMIRILVHHSCSHFKRDLSNTNIKDEYFLVNDGWKWLETTATTKIKKMTQERNGSDKFQIPERLESGMVINIRPIYVEGHYACVQWANGWTGSTVDGGLAAQAEGTIFINHHGEAEKL
jgi:methionine aminopeptidase